MAVVSERDDTERSAVTGDMLKIFLEAFNRHDLDAIMTFFTADCSFDFPRGPHPYGQRFVGKEAVRRGLASRFQGIPDVHYGDDRHFVSASSERGVSEWLLTGNSTNGEKIEVRGCDLFEFSTKDGKIKRKDSYWKIIQQVK